MFIRKSFQFNSMFKAKHPINRLHRTLGQRAADNITKFGGSWYFIFIFFFFLLVWITLNIIVAIKRWDPYPFILLNLLLSCLAAIQAPIILMSQNRQLHIDRLKAEYDYEVNKLAEKEIRELKGEVKEIKRLIKK